MKHIITTFLLAVLASTTFATGRRADTLTVALDHKLNPDHAPLIVAKEHGFFKEQGLDVKFVQPKAHTSSTKLIAANKADIAITYQPELMRKIDHGQSLIRVGTLIDRPLDCIIALKSSKIETLADLRGKKIGIHPHGFSKVMLKAMLRNAGLSEKDVKIVPLAHPKQALQQHKVDAIAGMMRNVDVPRLERSGLNVTTFFPEENGIPNYSVLVFAANKTNMDDARLPRFLTALKHAVDYLDEYPEEAWKSFVKGHPSANNKANHEMWLATLPYFAEDPAVFDSREWQHFAEFMHNNEMIKMAKPVSKYAVTIG